jgi:hypothetical protein
MTNDGDLTNVANYGFAGPSVLTATLITYTAPTTVTIQFAGVPVDLGVYTVTVTGNVKDLDTNTIDLLNNSAAFAYDAQPRVSSATQTAPSTSTLTLNFNKDMLNDADLTSAANYSITGPGVQMVTLVEYVNPTIVTVHLAGLPITGLYTITVTGNVKDLAGSTIDLAHNTAPLYLLFNFEVVSATASSANLVRVRFDMEVKHTYATDSNDALNPANYTFSSVLGTPVAPILVTLVTVAPTEVDLLLGDWLTSAVPYRVTVANVVTPSGGGVNLLRNYADLMWTRSDYISAIIWVAKDGNDVTGTGAQQDPYLTIERALQDFTTGDQIRIMEGVYTPTDTVVVTGMEGSIFAETGESVTIQPQRASVHNAALYVALSERFTIQGVNIIQSDDTNHLVGIYAENVDNFIAHTCSVNDFDSASGSVTGIYAIGSGRIYNCRTEDLTVTGGTVCGIRTSGVTVIDCIARRIRSYNGVALGIDSEL